MATPCIGELDFSIETKPFFGLSSQNFQSPSKGILFKKRDIIYGSDSDKQQWIIAPAYAGTPIGVLMLCVSTNTLVNHP